VLFLNTTSIIGKPKLVQNVSQTVSQNYPQCIHIITMFLKYVYIFKKYKYIAET